ncbi:MAG: hypothetical protein Q8S46_05635 [Methylotenera sp.]|nr:hypothetical protein [Methylotenera sp.]
MQINNIKVHHTDKEGPAFLKSDVDKAVMGLILVDDFFEGRAKKMATDVERAVERTEEFTNGFSTAIDKFSALEQKLSSETKRVTGNVRDASEKLASGLAKVEKSANFDRLEKYVLLLERAANAMHSLAELEASGKLEKIAASIR